MAKSADVSSEHFDWLVAGRSRNQQTTLDLYKIINVQEPVLNRNFVYQATAQQLVGIAFSLWRAVFLSDLTGNLGDQLADIKKFLQSLIAHNAVLYQTDFAKREWTFEYYLDNALFRLEKLPNDILPVSMRAPVTGSFKDQWTHAQTALDQAVRTFAEVIVDHRSN